MASPRREVRGVYSFLSSRWLLPALLFLVCVAFVAVSSWNVSIWTDESVTISAAERTLPQLWELLQNIDAVHGAYYAVMSLWVDVTGISPFWLRLPSALAFAGTVVGVLVLGRRLASPATALTAAVVCAMLPRLTWAGIEARPFIFSALAAVWCTWSYMRVVQRPSTVAWLVYGVLGATAVLVNIYLVLVIVGHGVTTLLERRGRRTLVAFAITGIGIALLTAPFLLLVRSQQAQLGGSGDRDPLSILRKILINQLFLGETPSADALPGWFTTVWQGAALLAALVGIGLIVWGCAARPRAGDDKRGVLALCLPWLLLPTAVIAAYAVLVAPVYQPRYFTFTVPAAALLIAVGLRALRVRMLVFAVALASTLAVLVIYASQRTPFAKSGSDWAEAAAAVARGAAAGDSVYYTPRYDDPGAPITLTARRIAQSYPSAFVNLEDLTLLETGAQTASLDGFSAPLAEVAEDLDRYRTVWMLYGSRYPESVAEQGADLLERAGFTGTVRWSGPGSVVVEYTRAG